MNKDHYLRAIQLFASGETTFTDNLYKDFKKEGYSREDILTFELYFKHFCDIVYADGFNPRDRNHVAAARASIKEIPFFDLAPIPNFIFSPEERKTILEAEKFGRVEEDEDGLALTIPAYEGSVEGVSDTFPAPADAFVIFSGHPETGTYACLDWLNMMKLYRGCGNLDKMPKLIFLGYKDNQGHTNFSDEFKYKVDSEAEMYKRVFQALGVPRDVLDECVMKTEDVSTYENIILTINTIKKYLINANNPEREIELSLYGYPAYERRIASEFSFQIQKFRDEEKLRSDEEVAAGYFRDEAQKEWIIGGERLPIINLQIVDREPRNENIRFASYDSLDAVGPDIIVGNCTANVFRNHGTERYNLLDGKKYPEAWKPILIKSLGYSYANIAEELAGVDIKEALVMKLLRDTMFLTYKWEDSSVVDAQIQGSVDWAKDLIAKFDISYKR